MVADRRRLRRLGMVILAIAIGLGIGLGLICLAPNVPVAFGVLKTRSSLRWSASPPALQDG